jgi:hypothetical protein
MLQYSPAKRRKNSVLASSVTAAAALVTNGRKNVERVVSSPLPRGYVEVE